LITQDIVERQNNGFVFIGRSDYVLNSGGLKISAEKIEQLIAEKILIPFFITGKKHEILGEEIVLVVEETKDIDLIGLNESIIEVFGNYAAIKRMIQKEVQLDTITGKVKRMKLD